MTTTPAAALRLAQAVPETAENYPILRELKAALKDLVAVTRASEVLEAAANQIQKDDPGNHVMWLRARAEALRVKP